MESVLLGRTPEFTLDEFQPDADGGFDVKSMVQRVTAPIFSTIDRGTEAKVEKEGLGRFDPAPFQQALTAGLEQLKQLREEADQKIAMATRETKAAEKAYHASMQELNHAQGAILSKFRRLDQQISKVSHTAVLVGHTLEAVDRQKQLNHKGLQIISHFIRFSSNRPEDQEKLALYFDVDSHKELLKAAEMIQELQEIAQGLDAAGTENATEQINKKAEQIESKLLKRFKDAGEEGKLHPMQSYAKTLLKFKSGQVNSQYEYGVIEHLDVKLANENTQEDVDKFQQFQNSLRTLYDVVIEECRQEVKVITQVFPNPVKVFKSLLLKRIIDDKIRRYLEKALDDSTWTRTKYLQVFEVAHERTKKLVEELTKLLPLLPNTSQDSLTAENINDTVEEILQPYRLSYLEKEMALLKHRAMKEIDKVLQVEPDGSRKEMDDGKGLMSRMATKKKKYTTEQIQSRITQSLHASTYKTIMGFTKEAIRRCQLLSRSTDAPDNVYQIFTLTMSLLSDQYVLVILGRAQAFLPSADPKTPPDWFWFTVVKLVNGLAKQLIRYYQTNVAPLLEADSNTLTIARARWRDGMRSVEQTLLSGLQRMQGASVSWTSKLLGKQKPVRYKPKDEGSTDFMEDNKVMGSVRDFVISHFEAVSIALEGRNLDQYLAVFGIKLHKIFVAHIKKSHISEVGASLLQRDVQTFQSILQEFHISRVNTLMHSLSHIVNIYFVPPGDLHALIADNPTLKQMEIRELKEYIQLRADFNQNKNTIRAQLVNTK